MKKTSFDSFFFFFGFQVHQTIGFDDRCAHRRWWFFVHIFLSPIAVDDVRSWFCPAYECCALGAHSPRHAQLTLVFFSSVPSSIQRPDEAAHCIALRCLQFKLLTLVLIHRHLIKRKETSTTWTTFSNSNIKCFFFHFDSIKYCCFYPMTSGMTLWHANVHRGAVATHAFSSSSHLSFIRVGSNRIVSEMPWNFDFFSSSFVSLLMKRSVHQSWARANLIWLQWLENQ